MKFKIALEYNGANYSGWQKQQNAKTVQGTLINAIRDVFKKAKGENKFIDLQGSGRTDAGVHAYEQIAHLECETMLAPEILKMKLNDILPSDINILDIEKADNKFHARHSAKSREYIYRISKRRTAFEKRYVWWVKDKLDIKKMKEAAKLFKGFHDFSSFSEEKKGESTTVEVEDCFVREDDMIISIHIKASHFLWKMVRRITGAIVESGRGNLSEKDIVFYLNNKSNDLSKFTAPPSGLFLSKVNY